MQNLDIKNFSQLSGINDGDRVLLVQSNGYNGSLPFALFSAIISNRVAPTIGDNGNWHIGGVDSGISAEPIAPQMERRADGIYSSTDGGDTWIPVLYFSDVEGRTSEIALSDIDFTQSALLDIARCEAPSIYAVYSDLGGHRHNVGLLEMVSDDQWHMVTQMFHTHYLLNADGTLSDSHSDDEVFTYTRSYHLAVGGSSDIPVGAWGAWKEGNAVLQAQLDAKASIAYVDSELDKKADESFVVEVGQSLHTMGERLDVTEENIVTLQETTVGLPAMEQKVDDHQKQIYGEGENFTGILDRVEENELKIQDVLTENLPLYVKSVSLSGRDLKATKGDGTPTTVFTVGTGLTAKDNSHIEVNVGDGLSASQTSPLTIKLGAGLEFDDQKRVKVAFASEVFVVVTSLPSIGVENKIYLVPVTDAEENDAYTEHAYINGKWESIGTQKGINLTDYYTNERVDELLATKADKSTVTALSDTVDAHEDSIGKHATRLTQAEGKINSLQTTTGTLQAAVSSHTTEIEALDTDINGGAGLKVRVGSCETNITSLKERVTDVESALDNKADSSALNGYVPTSRTVAGKALSADVTTGDIRSAIGMANGTTSGLVRVKHTLSSAPNTTLTSDSNRYYPVIVDKNGTAIVNVPWATVSDEVAGEISELNSRLTTVESEVDTATSTANTANQQVSLVKERVSLHETAINGQGGLVDQMEEANAQITDLWDEKPSKTYVDNAVALKQNTLKSTTTVTVDANSEVSVTDKVALKTDLENLLNTTDFNDALTSDSSFKSLQTSVNGKLNTSTYTTDKATFATKTELGSYLQRRRMTNPSDGTSAVGAIPFNVLALKSAGTPLYEDPEFAKGVNSVLAYNTPPSTNYPNLKPVTITRISDTQSSANSSGYILQLSSPTGEMSPGRGGFYHVIQSRANAVFAQIFRAKIPVGYNVTIANNPTGTGRTEYWLTDVAGTGKWEWYCRIAQCGSSGSFSITGHVYLVKENSSVSDAVTWYLSYANVIDLTKGNVDGLLGVKIGTGLKFDDTDTLYVPTASSSDYGCVKTTSTVTSTSGLTACPIISGVPYYKATSTTLSGLGVTATATELNYVDGVTSNIQTQLNAKVPTTRTIGGYDLADNITAEELRTAISTATDTRIGLIKTSYTQNGKNYPVKADNIGNAYVSVPWTDTNTTYSPATTSAAGLMSAADKSKLDGIATGANNYTLPTATASAIGGIKVADKLTTAPGTALTTTPNRYYKIELDKNGLAVVNVPWTDTNTTYTLSSFGITATATELNKLDGVTATTAQLNYVSGVTSNIQTQLNGKLSTGGTAADSSKLGGVSLAHIKESAYSLSFKNQVGVAQWIRVGEFIEGNIVSNTCLIFIGRNYNSPTNEGYVWSFANAYNDAFCLTQLSGNVGGHQMTKVRIVYKNSQKMYFDVYTTSGSYQDIYYCQAVGRFTTYDAAEFGATIPNGYSSVEYDTYDGMYCNEGFTGDVTGTATGNLKSFSISSTALTATKGDGTKTTITLGTGLASIDNNKIYVNVGGINGTGIGVGSDGKLQVKLGSGLRYNTSTGKIELALGSGLHFKADGTVWPDGY